MDPEKVEKIPMGAVKVVSGGHVRNTKVYIKTANGLVDISQNVIAVRWSTDVREYIAHCEVDLLATEVEVEAEAAVAVVHASLVSKFKAWLKAKLGGSMKEAMVLFAALMLLAGCNLSVSKSCQAADKDGYTDCHFTAQWDDSPLCAGSCAVKK